MFAEIIPETKTWPPGTTFTYSVPARLQKKILPGQLVKINFGPRQVFGIVYKTTARPTITAKKILPIVEIVDPIPALSQNHLKLAVWLAAAYWTSWAKAAFAMLPPIAKRLTKTDFPTGLAKETFGGLAKLPSIALGAQPQRVSYYLQKTEEVLKAQKQVLTIFPDLYMSRHAVDYFQSYFGKMRTAVWQTKIKVSERYKLWQQIRTGNFRLVIGNRSAIFAPLNNLGLIIVDDFENFAYKQEQEPRYQTHRVASALSHLFRSQLILGEEIPSIAAWISIKKQRLAPAVLSKPHHSQLQIIDMHNQFSTLGFELEQAISDTLQNNGQILLYLNRRGRAKMVDCADCRASTYLENTTDLLLACPICQSPRTHLRVFGTQKVEQDVRKLWPGKKIVRVDKDAPVAIQDLAQADIIIGTKAVFNHTLPPIDLVGVVLAEVGLGLPDYQISERVFVTLKKLSGLSPKTIVQTYQIDNPVVQALTGPLDNFYKEELLTYKKFGYPPYKKLVNLIFAHPSFATAEKEAGRLASEIKKLTTDFPGFEMMGPQPCFHKIIRGKFRWQIILKIPPERVLAIQSKIYQIKGLEKWKIDPEPIDLL